MESSMAADTLRIEAVDPEKLLGELVGQAVDVWANAHGLGRASATRREFGGDRVPRHAGREGFLFLGAFEPGGRLVGFVYGYTGASGQWWYDRVAAALDPARRGGGAPAGRPLPPRAPAAPPPPGTRVRARP